MMASSVSLSNEGFSSTVWGPGVWKFIHMIALNVPLNPSEDQKRGYAAFFKSLQHVLPCSVCRVEYTKLTGRSIDPNIFSNRAKAFAWTVRLHFMVSRRLKKKRDLSPAIDWAAHYESMRYTPHPLKKIRPLGKRVLVEYHPADTLRVRATVSRLVPSARVRLMPDRTLSPGTFRVMNTRVFSTLADVLRVL